MEEEKAAADYEELTRKGGGAARFKQSLGFSSTDSNHSDAVPARAKHDEANGMGSGWERFNFDKDAPLDDEEIEEDDGALVKHIGQTFRFSAVEAKREEKIKATHDEAIFGTSSLAPPLDTDSEVKQMFKIA